MTTTHKKSSAIADGADATQVLPSDWNDRHATSLLDSEVGEVMHRQALVSTDRLTAAGTAELRVLEQIVPFLGSYGIGSPSILTDQFLLQYRRASLAGNGRASLQGNAELFIFDLAPVGRLVLAGRGG